ncbi:NifU-like N terminal domain-containing protein [Lipomyces tetrasporus]
MNYLTRQFRPAASAAIRANPAAIAVSGSRGYHQKDKYIFLLRGFLRHMWHHTLQNEYYHYNKPRNVGSMDKDDVNVGTGLVGAPACGDVMKLQIRVDDNGIISDVKFKTFGCGSAIASSSYLTELVRGMSLDEAGKVKNTAIAKELSLPPVKLHCSMLAEDAIKSAIKDYKSKRAGQTVFGATPGEAATAKQVAA